MPGGNASKRYSPSPVVFVLREIPVSVFVAVTAASGTDPPFGSRARPVIVANAALWPYASLTLHNSTTARHNSDVQQHHIVDFRFMNFPLLIRSEMVRQTLVLELPTLGCKQRPFHLNARLLPSTTNRHF